MLELGIEPRSMTDTCIATVESDSFHLRGRLYSVHAKPTKLTDLVSVGPATERDLNELGITSPDQLKGRNADELFAQLQVIKGQRVDPCCHDVFRCAIAQVENPDLPDDQKQWFYWSKVRRGKIKR